MRILWFTTESTRYSSSSVACYGSSGLIDALQDSLLKDESLVLGMAFSYAVRADKEKRGNVTYYPMFHKVRKHLQKLFYYWHAYKKEQHQVSLPDMLNIIDDFQPDVIQIFGIESPFACILGHTDIPVIVHLQGFLNPTHNAFYPQGMNRFTFLLKTFSLNEWLLRNGNNFAADQMCLRTKTERDYFRHMKYCVGRTEWDSQITGLLAPQSRYFHIGELLREEFDKKTWEIPPLDKFVLVSTISQTVYKGLDVILKTAKLLREFSGICFEWRIVGVKSGSKYVTFFEKHCGIRSEEVNIKYLGVCDASQICDQLHESHVYVHPSYIDNSPNSLCEAQYVGLPVIGTYVGGIPSLITHQENGLLVPANAPYELSHWIKHLNQHPETMIQLGKAARKTALARHSKEKIVSDLLDVYHQIQSQEKSE